MPRANLSGKVSLDDSAFRAGVRRVKMSAAGLGREVSKSFKVVSSSLASVASTLAKIGTIAGTITFAAAVAGVSKLIKSSSGVAANFETIRVTMGGYLKDLGKADAILNEIAQFSVVTPFETTGLQAATNTLLGAGIAGESVVDVLKEIAAVSKTTAQVNELADALSKGFAKGKFQTEELNKFLERGINLMPELAKITGKTGEELQKAIQKGLKFDDVRRAIAAMSAEGGLFFGMLEKQSKTSTGLISTLSSNWDEFLLKFGQPINDAVKPLLDVLIVQVQNLTAAGKSMGEVIAGGITNLVSKMEGVDFVGMGQKFLAGLNMEKALELMKATFSVAARFLGKQVIFAFAKALELIGAVWDKWAKAKAEAMGAALKKALILAINPVAALAGTGHNTKKLFDDADEAGNTIADAMLRTLDGEDALGMDAAIAKLKDVFADILDAGGVSKTPDETPQPSPAAPSAPFIDGKVFADSPEGKALMAGFAKAEEPEQRSRIALTLPTPMSLQQSALQAAAMKTSEAAGAGFRGMAGLHGMQVERLAGIGPGQNNVFARDRNRLGIASGLNSGGLGEARRVGAAKDAKVAKRDETLGGTNKRLDTATTLLSKQNELLQAGLN